MKTQQEHYFGHTVRTLSSSQGCESFIHSFYADPDPAVFLNADPYPGPGPAYPNLKKKNNEEFS